MIAAGSRDILLPVTCRMAGAAQMSKREKYDPQSLDHILQLKVKEENCSCNFVRAVMNIVVDKISQGWIANLDCIRIK